ncbi:rhodanese-related sulfurtransferase [Marinobacterium halophilum]|uniref:Rhodanese-related sulfurtransferase n=1 Tax=Marinobacterium halophilum TaxID=267374 RepID=A0A2P8EIW2_9GAMM|nr:rhodanese-like domain-containing protein [Marinobacterium halophilum]PSL09382.1 rhodanese-related sulfurtransferase [Marinobacterium halophilum]
MKTAHDLVIAAKENIREITVADADEAIGSADLLVDVREPDEYRAGHVAGAINIPRGLLEFKFSNDDALISRDLNIVLYCKNSGRAALSAKSLAEMGYLHVQSISGGIEAWIAANKPVVTPSLPTFE